MSHTLPALPYPYDSLEPMIDARTMLLHHDKHHRAYVDKLNKALEEFPKYQSLTVEELLMRLDGLDPKVRDAIRKQGGGHANHSLFWQSMAPNGRPASTSFARRIESEFRSLEGLKDAFRVVTEQVFGSGWVFLSTKHSHPLLTLHAFANQDSPLSVGFKPLLALDLWEHAYYLHYQQDRPHWFDAWWSLVDWQSVEQRFEQAQAQCAA